MPAAAAIRHPLTPQKRRAQSNPGEQAIATVRALQTHRVTAPEPYSEHKKQRTTRQQTRIMHQLDEAHAKRIAYLAANEKTLSRPASSGL